MLKAALGGWQTNAIVTIQSGYPFNVTVPGERQSCQSTTEPFEDGYFELWKRSPD
jgi:hypothetical protein